MAAPACPAAMLADVHSGIPGYLPKIAQLKQ